VEKERNAIMSVQDEEMDLYEVVLLLKKRFKLVAGVFFIAVAFAVAASLLAAPVYRGSFICRVPYLKSGHISALETEKLIESLKLLREEKRLDELSAKLEMTKEEVRGIVSLKAKTPKDTEDLVEITVDVRAPELIIGVKNGILKFLNGNSYVREKIDRERDSIVILKEETRDRINRMEKLSNAVSSQSEQGGIKDVGLTPIYMQEGAIRLREKVNDLDNELARLEGFLVVTEPGVPKVPVKPRIAVNVAVAVIASLILGVFLAFFVEWLERSRGGHLNSRP
jgi:capsular polysaccharide biosynthesis protein